MTGRPIQRTRTSDWHSATTTCVAPLTWLSTRDPALTLVSAPMPALLIRFGAGAGAVLSLAQAAAPVPVLADRRALLPLARFQESPAAEWLLPAELVPAAADALPTPATAEPPADDEPAAAAVRAAEEDPGPQEAPDIEETAPNSNRIELIIDSLPHHELTEPIPVTINALGDEMFTATMRNLDIAATGNSIGEALLFLKEQIESLYDELNRRLSHLSTDQKTTLQMLQTYIAASPPRRARWL